MWEKIAVKVGSMLCSICTATCGSLQCLQGCGMEIFCKKFDKWTSLPELD